MSEKPSSSELPISTPDAISRLIQESNERRINEKILEISNIYDENPENLRRIAELSIKMEDPEYLPTYDEVISVFSSCDDDLTFQRFCRYSGPTSYQFLNWEYVESFTDYLAQRIDELSIGRKEPVVILEVAAGNGRLSHFVEKFLHEKIDSDSFRLIATDPCEPDWKNIRHNEDGTFPVAVINHAEAVNLYKPQIVLCSWMPSKKDLTQEFRDTTSVEEYILIGETDGGCSGDSWKTWGWDNDESHGNEITKYKIDGFSRDQVDGCDMFSIGFSDAITKRRIEQHSQTTTFKRDK